MKQSTFEALNQAGWNQLEQELAQLEQGRTSASAGNDFAQRYRQLCQHLALAEARGYSTLLVDYLQQLAMRAHKQFYVHRSHVLGRCAQFLLIGFPQLVRREWRLVLLASLLFFGSLLVTSLLSYFHPELIHTLLPAADVRSLEHMYSPKARSIGPQSSRGADDDWMMFGFYIMNNISIAFRTFATGILWGIGSLFILLFNGLYIGFVAGYLIQAGYSETFCSFVIGHGAFELTAIALAGAAGLKLGWALLAPGRLRRTEALRRAARQGIRIMFGVFVFLLLAAVIEAFWSSSRLFNAEVKYLVGALFWLLMFAYLTLAGRSKHAPD